MSRRRFLVLFLSAFILYSVAIVQPVRAEETYSLQRVYKAGDSDKYRSVINIEGDGPMGAAMKAEVSAATIEAVKEIKEDGTTIVTNTLESCMLKVGDQEMPFPNAAIGKAETITYDKNGKVIKRASAGGQGNVGQILAMTRIENVPDRPLKIGEEWKFDIPGGDKKDRPKTGVIKLVSREKVRGNGPEALKVKYLVDGVMPTGAGEGKIHVEATAYLEPETRKILLLEGTVTGLKLGPTGDTKVSFKQEKITPDAKDKK